MLPLNCAVRIVNEGDNLNGEVAFIHKQPGDESVTGDSIPEGWYEVVLDPWGNGFQKTLYREENIEVCGC
jgi:hypothetical protein